MTLASRLSRTASTALAVLLALSIGATSAGCYRFTVRPAKTGITEYHGRTVHSYAWNLIDKDPIVEFDECGDRGLYAARAKTNLGFIAVSFLTFGAWVPMRLEWRCAQDASTAAELSKPAGSDPGSR
jgi:hypothetical protein